jgi:hypothetical protein
MPGGPRGGYGGQKNSRGGSSKRGGNSGRRDFIPQKDFPKKDLPTKDFAFITMRAEATLSGGEISTTIETLRTALLNPPSVNLDDKDAFDIIRFALTPPPPTDALGDYTAREPLAPGPILERFLDRFRRRIDDPSPRGFSVVDQLLRTDMVTVAVNGEHYPLCRAIFNDEATFAEYRMAALPMFCACEEDYNKSSADAQAEVQDSIRAWWETALRNVQILFHLHYDRQQLRTAPFRTDHITIRKRTSAISSIMTPRFRTATADVP